jgi:hypothetical protein
MVTRTHLNITVYIAHLMYIILYIIIVPELASDRNGRLCYIPSFSLRTNPNSRKTRSMVIPSDAAVVGSKPAQDIVVRKLCFLLVCCGDTSCLNVWVYFGVS